MKSYKDEWAKWVANLSPADMARVELEISKVRAKQEKEARTLKWFSEGLTPQLELDLRNIKNAEDENRG